MRALLLSLLLCIFACDGGIRVPESTDAPEDPAATDTDASETPTTRPPATADTDLDPDTDAIDPGVAEGPFCDNVSDLATLGGLDPADIGSAAQTCSLGCLNPPSGTNRRTCIANCMESEIGVSAGCASCFGGIGACIINRCALQCAAPTSSACESCRQSQCEPAFIECAGVDPI